MQHFPTKAVALVALCVPLGACNSFLGIHFAGHGVRAAPLRAAVSTNVPKAMNENATATGRKHLAEGQPGLAIEAFQRALAGGEPVAPAVNGLGVAYARIGRFDLAQRYFEQAAASDPANSQYSDNLARLMRSPALALRREGDMARAALQAAAEQAATAKVAESAKAAQVPGRLQRVSRGEVRIASVAAPEAPIARGKAAVAQGFRPLIRITFADRDAASAPIRITLPEAKPATAEPEIADAAAVPAGPRH